MMEANRSGASAYITKPFRIDHLLRTIATCYATRACITTTSPACRRWRTCRSRCSGCCSTTASSASIYVHAAACRRSSSCRASRSSTTCTASSARRLVDARGELIRGDDFVSISSLGDAFLIILSPLAEHRRHRRGGPAGWSNSASRRSCWRASSPSWRAVCSPRSTSSSVRRGSTQSPKIRFKRALLDAIARATQSIEAERDEIRAHLRGEFEAVMTGEQLTCVFQPIVNLKDFAAIGYELLSRGPRAERAAPPGRALRHRPPRGPRRGAGPAVPSHRVTRRGGPAAGLPALRQHRADDHVPALSRRRLRAGVRGGDAVGAPRPDGRSRSPRTA